MKKQKYMLPIMALVFVNIIWGINTPLIKLGLQSIPVPILMSIKFLTASLILLPFAIRTWKPLKRKDFLLLILSSVMFNSLGGLALNFGLTKTTSINAAVLGLLAPLLLFILSVEFLKERLSLKTLLGILIALAGSVIIIGRVWDGGVGGQASLAGNLFVVASIFCIVIGTLLFKPLVKKTSAYQLACVSFFFGILPITVIAAAQLHSWDISATTQSSWMALVASTAVIVMANPLFFYAMGHKKLQGLGVYEYIQPIAAILAAGILLSERPSPRFALGAGLVFLGIYLAEMHKSRRSLMPAHHKN